MRLLIQTEIFKHTFLIETIHINQLISKINVMSYNLKYNKGI